MKDFFVAPRIFPCYTCGEKQLRIAAHYNKKKQRKCMYTFDSRIRYSETDETGALSLLGVINYMQDCSTFQSEDIGLGVEYLEKKKRAWLLSSWRIVIDRYPVLGERIKIGTWATSSKGIYGYRDFVLMDQWRRMTGRP